MIMENRKGLDITVDGVGIEDTVFYDNKEFKVVALDIISYHRANTSSLLLNGYSDSCSTLKEMIGLDIEEGHSWIIIYDNKEKKNYKYSLWVSRDEVRI